MKNATPGPWKVDHDDMGAMGSHGWVSPHGAYSDMRVGDNELMALAPVLAVLVADMAEALEGVTSQGIIYDADWDDFNSLLSRLYALRPEDTA